LVCVRAVMGATADEWRAQSIYQVMTDRYGLSDDSITTACDPAEGKYCGGTWDGIIHNLDYIQNMGFTAIWISPVTANLPQYTSDLGSYHGYWQQNMYQLNSNFGDVATLQNLSAAIHARGMYLMVDVVVNHFAWAGDETTIQYNRLIPFNNESYYHSYCPITTSSSQTDCWLGDDVVSLPDLRTEDSDVMSIFQTWISSLVTQYNIDGLRLDSAGNVDTAFFPSFGDAANVFMIGEVNSGVVSYACPYQSVMDSILNYPVYFPLTRAFASTEGSMLDLANEISWMQSSCKDTTILGSFSENHDQPRFPSYTNDMAAVKNVITFTMLADGIPIIYEGQEQHYSGGANPLNREAVWLSGYATNSTLYSFITTLNVFRTQAIKTDSNYLTYQNYIIYNDTMTIAMRKGFNGSQVVTVLSNMGEDGGERTFNLSSTDTGFTSGEVVTEVLSCTNTTVGSSNNLEVKIQAGAPLVFYPSSHLINTTICVNGNTTNPNPVSSNPPPKKGAASTNFNSQNSVVWICAALFTFVTAQEFLLV